LLEVDGTSTSDTVEGQKKKTQEKQTKERRGVRKERKIGNRPTGES